MQDKIPNIVVAILASLIVGVIVWGQLNGNKSEQQCIAKGGTYYKAIDVTKSLCKLGAKHNG